MKVVLRSHPTKCKSHTYYLHVYKEIWEASTGEYLLCQRENGNRADPFAMVAVKRLLSALPH